MSQTDLADLSGGPDATLLPPRRLGALLTSARASHGRTIEELVDLSAGRFSRASLASIERGTVAVDDAEMAVLARLYGVETTSLVPARSHLVIDLQEGLVDVDGRSQRMRPQASRAEVLDSYLSLVYSMRQAAPGSKITLRVEDLDVLGRALDIGTGRLAVDLESLMADADGHLGWRSRLLSRRVLVPAAGILVAMCGVGALLLVSDGGAVRPTGAPAAVGITTPVRADAPIVAPAADVEIGTAVTQERSPDGGAGPVTERTGAADATGSTVVPVSPDPSGADVEIGEPLVVERPVVDQGTGINPPTT